MATFKEAFAAARKEKGAGKTFTWQGKSYTTDLASEKKSGPKKSTAETAPPRRPAAPPVKAAKPAVTTPTSSPRPRTAVSGVANAKPVADKFAKDMINKNIVKATGDKLAADRKAEAASVARDRDNALRKVARQGGGRVSKGVKELQANQAALRKGVPLGKSTGIGGRAAEAVKSFIGGFKVNAGKNKTVAKAPNRSDVTRKK